MQNLVLNQVPKPEEELNLPYTWTQTDNVVRVEIPLKKGGIHGTVFYSNVMIFQYNRKTVENLSGELMAPINEQHCFSKRHDDDTVLIILAKKNKNEPWDRLFKKE